MVWVKTGEDLGEWWVFVLLWNKVKDPAWRNRCIVCDQELSGDFWHTPKATIYRRVTRGAIDGRTVEVHVKCMSEGEILGSRRRFSVASRSRPTHKGSSGVPAGLTRQDCCSRLCRVVVAGQLRGGFLSAWRSLPAERPAASVLIFCWLGRATSGGQRGMLVLIGAGSHSSTGAIDPPIVRG